MEYDPSNGNIYTANFDSGDISVIDSSTNKVISTFNVGDDPQDIKYNPSNGNIYVANENSDNVSLITTTTTATTTAMNSTD
jgi:YVTN family beta-propeller protein